MYARKDARPNISSDRLILLLLFIWRVLNMNQVHHECNVRHEALPLHMHAY